MKNNNLIVMLTYNDCTVDNAMEVFSENRLSPAVFWGMKEKNLPFEEMKKVFSLMKSSGKSTVLEVVAYTEKEGLEGAEKAAELGSDILMGTKFHDSINEFCRSHSIKYMPYVGQVSGRPSLLQGEASDMIENAYEYIKKGVYGITLLSYRYKGNADELSRKITGALSAPVVIAGSIDSEKKLSDVKSAAPWAFTVGSAFFDKKFGGSFSEEIKKVTDFMK